MSTCSSISAPALGRSFSPSHHDASRAARALTTTRPPSGSPCARGPAHDRAAAASPRAPGLLGARSGRCQLPRARPAARRRRVGSGPRRRREPGALRDRGEPGALGRDPGARADGFSCAPSSRRWKRSGTGAIRRITWPSPCPSAAIIVRSPIAACPAWLTAIPAASMEPLRAFIYGGVRGILVPPARRPPPFTTYHTTGDALGDARAAHAQGGRDSAQKSWSAPRRGGPPALVAPLRGRAPSGHGRDVLGREIVLAQRAPQAGGVVGPCSWAPALAQVVAEGRRRSAVERRMGQDRFRAVLLEAGRRVEPVQLGG